MTQWSVCKDYTVNIIRLVTLSRIFRRKKDELVKREGQIEAGRLCLSRHLFESMQAESRKRIYDQLCPVRLRSMHENRTFAWTRFTAHRKVYGERDRSATYRSCHACQSGCRTVVRSYVVVRIKKKKRARIKDLLTENRLEGLLVPVPDDIHTSVDNRTPEIFRAPSTGPILSPGYDVTRRDVPHST